MALLRLATVLLPTLLEGTWVPLCEEGVNMPGGNLPDMPLAAPSSEACAEACKAEQGCSLFSFHTADCTYHGTSCMLPGGCCYLKFEETVAWAPQVDNCSCSGYVRVPKTNFQPTRPAPAGARNVLYILVDDLRTELEAYGQSPLTHHSPHMQNLARSSLVFDNAYCQIAVCSPSRNSFLTGRRPDHSRIYNFIDHFRQADCGLTEGGTAYTGPLLREVEINNDCMWGGEAPCGASGQCCTICTEYDDCHAWTYTHANTLCRLFSAKGGAVPDIGAVSGLRGTFATRASWTSMPEHFRRNGWLTLSSGKIFHTEEGAAGSSHPDRNGPGMPPNQDPPSWSTGLSMRWVNAVANMWNCQLSDGSCAVDTDHRGIVRNPRKDKQLSDRVVADDAVVKLRLAAQNREATGQPFFLAAGFRKPHLPYRVPAATLSLLPPAQDVDVALHPTLHPSVPPIAHHDIGPQFNPYVAVANDTAQQWRQYYRAAVAWADSQIGRVLHELETLGLAEETMVVLHSDHGYGLGEHGEWQKFANSEQGTRVPLMMRVPWIPQSQGQRTKVLAELVDIFPTIAEALSVPMVGPEAESLDGRSLLPVLVFPRDTALATWIKPFALSQYMRCPQDPAKLWQKNDCLFVDRTQIPFFGYSLRTPNWRYTEWARWDGANLKPDWASVVGRELYSHAGDVGFDFNQFENINDDTSHPEIVALLSSYLHEIVANQTRLPPRLVEVQTNV